MTFDSDARKRLKKTGRTTRMLEEAKRLAREGRSVYVVAANNVEKERLERLCGTPELGIRFGTPHVVEGFCWETMRYRGMPFDSVVLVDHYAVECHLGRALEMMHAYDVPEVGGESFGTGSDDGEDRHEWKCVSSPPVESHMYRVKCGISGECFWARWDVPTGRWQDIEGEFIAFGRPECGDVWLDGFCELMDWNTSHIPPRSVLDRDGG